MKITFVSLVAVSLVSLSFFPYEARAEKGRSGRVFSPAPTTTTTNTYREEASSGGMRYGFGFSTFGGVNNGHSVSAMIEMTAHTTLQINLAIGSTSPFTIGGGGVLRHSLVGNQDLGFHGGLGFAMGAGAGGGAAAGSAPFFCDIFPVLGFHFGLGGAASNVHLSFDGGPLFHVTPSPFQFSVQPASLLVAGASIHYMF